MNGQVGYGVIYHENMDQPTRNALSEFDNLRVDGLYTSSNSRGQKFGMKFSKDFVIISSKSFFFNQFFKMSISISLQHLRKPEKNGCVKSNGNIINWPNLQ